MSTLTVAVEARYATSRLVELTNKNSKTATTTNATVLALAATDAAAEFETYAMQAFDDTNAQHIRLCVTGVMAILRTWTGQDGSDKILEDWRAAVERYATTSSRKRIVPLCNRTEGPTADLDSDGIPRRPEFDKPRFQRLDVASPWSPDPDES